MKIRDLTEDERSRMQNAVLSELNDAYQKSGKQTPFESVIMKDPFPVQVKEMIAAMMSHVAIQKVPVELAAMACAEGIVMLHNMHIKHLQAQNDSLREILDHLNN